MTTRQRLAAVLPVVLLSLVALNQIRIAHNSDMTAWKGGGFGMFSTLDRPRARQVRVHILGAGRDIPFSVPPELRNLSESAKTRPTEKKLLRLGREIAVRLKPHLPELEIVRVEVWRRSLDLESRTIRTEKWREAAYTVASGDD